MLLPLYPLVACVASWLFLMPVNVVANQVRFTNFDAFQHVKAGEPVNVTWEGDGSVCPPSSPFPPHPVAIPTTYLSP